MPPDEEQMVPISRLNAKSEALKKAEERAAAAEARISELEPLAGKAEKLKADLKAEREAHASTRSASEETLTLVSAGITDPEDQELVRWRRSRLGEEAPPLKDYLAGAAREDRHLSALFAAPKAAEPEAPAAAPEAPAAPKAPPAGDNAGVAPTPAPSSGDKIAEYSAKMKDPEWLRQNLDTAMRDLGFGS